MAVGFDSAAFSDPAGVNDPSQTHTPVGTLRGGLLFVLDGDTTMVDNIDGGTWGGVSMVEIPGSPALLATGEPHAVHGFFIGASIPTGAQTVQAITAGTYNFPSGGELISIGLTAAADTEVVDSDGTIATASGPANPSVTLSLGGRSCFCAIGFGSGVGTVGGITPLADWTSIVEIDYGQKVAGCYRYNIIGTTDVTAGYTSNADDATLLAVAISEILAGFAPPPPLVRPSFRQVRRYGGVR